MPKPTRSQPPVRGDARVALLDATLEHVRRQGWAATSIDQLCKAVGVTKGAFFHHFPSKEALGVAAADHWSAKTGQLFANAKYHDIEDPLDRIFGYIDFRASLSNGPLEAFTCFVGTTVQESFATSEPIREACGASMFQHAERLATDFRAALERYPPRASVTAEGLAQYTQVVVQGGFVLAKAVGDRGPLLAALEHLKTYLELLFDRSRPATR